MTRAALIAIVLVACGTPAVPKAAPASPSARPVAPLPLDEDMPTLATRTLKLYESTASVLTTANATCATATAQLAALKTENLDYLAARTAVISEGRTRALQEKIDANEVHGQPLATAAALILNAPLLKSCATDRGFTDAYEDLFGTPR